MSDLPQSYEAELALIGAVVSAGKITGTAEQVAPADFSNNLYRDIWEKLCELVSNDKPIDLSLMDYHFNTAADIPTTLAEITRGVAMANVINMDAYADAILTTSARRKLRLALGSISQIVYSDGHSKPESIFAEAEAILADAQDGIIRDEREVWTDAELAALVIDTDPFLLPGFVVEGGLNLISGKPGVGKTFAAMDFATAVASGGRSWGREIKQGERTILFMGADNGRTTIQRRVADLCKGREIEPPGVIYDLSPLDLSSPTGMAILRSEITKTNADVLIIDTLVAYAGAYDENSASDMGKYMAFLRELCRRTGTTLLIVHHMRKGPAAGGDSVRGSNVIQASMDSSMELRATGSGPNIVRTLVHLKCREAEESSPIAFTIAEGEHGGLVLPFEAGDAKVAAQTMIEASVNVVVAAMAEAPGEHFRTKDLKYVLQDAGMPVGSRTMADISKHLKILPFVKWQKVGRFNEFWWEH